MRVLSGIQPSGLIHIGNYLGAIRQWRSLQEDNECLFCITDLHAITVPYEPRLMQERVLEAALSYLASGIDPQKAVIFVQSHVPEHTELCWLLNSVAPVGDLTRMTQYKDKTQKFSSEKHFIPAGLLNYPVLMAADILLYKTERVPIGQDQMQHLEFTRTLAEHFNKRFGKTFPLPKELTGTHSSRVRSLTDPERKMAKSDHPDNYISLFEKPGEIRRKVMKAVTDSGKTIAYQKEKKPGISNLLEIYASFADMDIKEAEERFSSASYADFKQEVAELLTERLGEFREKRAELAKDPEHVRALLAKGAERARGMAQGNIAEIKKRMGLL